MIYPVECLLCGCVFDGAEAVTGSREEPNTNLPSIQADDVWCECPECKGRVTVEERHNNRLQHEQS